MPADSPLLLLPPAALQWLFSPIAIPRGELPAAVVDELASGAWTLEWVKVWM